MQQVTVGTKNQIVIPKIVRKKIKEFRPGSRVKVYKIDDETIGIRVSPEDWAERTQGILKGVWKVDPIKEIEKMREEWG